MQLILLGAPGSGKGTQAQKIADKYGLGHISTGDMLRQEVSEASDLGLKAKAYMDKGELVPDEIILGMVGKRIGDNNPSRGFILDGFPRNISQAKAVENVLEKVNSQIDAVINIDLDEEEVLKRLEGRRVCRSCEATYNVYFNPPKKEGVCDKCGGELYQRDDDQEEVIKNRFSVYLDSTAPLIDYYKDKRRLKTVSGRGSIEEVFKSISGILDQID